MPRFFVPLEQIDGESVFIRGKDVNHIKNVLRMRPGDEVSLSDGSGKDYFCTITECMKDEVKLHIENSWESYAELPVKITLFQGLPKADKMEFIIQKAVELGVYEVVPVKTERVIVRLDEKKQEKKLQRWQQIAESAAKQAGRAFIPEVRPVVTFEQALAESGQLDGCLIPYEKAKGMDAAREHIRSLHGSRCIGIFIGPEGGFELSEVEKAREAGVVPVTLGHRILRTETAGMTMLSILMFEFEEDD